MIVRRRLIVILSLILILRGRLLKVLVRTALIKILTVILVKNVLISLFRRLNRRRWSNEGVRRGAENLRFVCLLIWR